MNQTKGALGAIVIGFLIFSGILLSYLKSGRDFRETRPELTELKVFTHSSFMGAYGPGPHLKKSFEESCKCKVEFIDVGSGELLIERLKLKENERVDLVIGLDQLTVKRAYDELRWKAIDFPKVNFKLEAKQALLKWFVPYDYSPMTFIYRTGEGKPPTSLDSLLSDKYKLSLQDPRTSTPGLQFLYWMFSIHGKNEAFDYLKKIQSNIHSISPSWSASYGLFKSKQADLTFSYLTSVVYHWVEEKDESYQAVALPEGHPMQIEYAAIPDRCLNCKMAESFINHMLRNDSQKIIMEKNYMLPVVEGIEAGTAFSKLPQLKTLGVSQVEQFTDANEQLLKDWEKIFRQ